MKKVMLILAFTFLSLALPAQRKSVCLGGFFSPRACGVTLVFPRDRSFSDLRLSADLGGVIRGETAIPGVRAEWQYNYILSRWEVPDGTHILLYAGPGAMLGYVYDGSNGRGVAAALNAAVGGGFRFPGSPVLVTVGFSGSVGCHLTMTDSHDSRMTLYKTGLRNFLTPEISLRYDF
ncbi:MAG: hypothetical protein IJ652_00555 [Bacteroidales bacterium]|nr:hypothetical protein [Bacteroidales bacterium]